MDLIGRLNNSIKYIEENLDGEISYEKAAKIAYCSSYHYQRMFSFMADITLADYIRRRRLTLAALELQQDKHKVIDVSLKYGYSSPTSFTRAFIKVHGIKPSEAKENGVNLKLYPPISFNISIKGGFAMNYRIEEKDEFRVVGVKENVSTIGGENFKRIPEIWKESMKKGTWEKINNLSNKKDSGIMGICSDFKEDNFNYYIASISNKEIPDGMEELKIKKGTWVVFSCKGLENLQDTWRKIFTDWFPSSGYEHAEEAEIEWYPENSKELVCEIWIPIIKK